jgi:hypothetical protein
MGETARQKRPVLVRRREDVIILVCMRWYLIFARLPDGRNRWSAVSLSTMSRSGAESSSSQIVRRSVPLIYHRTLTGLLISPPGHGNDAVIIDPNRNPRGARYVSRWPLTSIILAVTTSIIRVGAISVKRERIVTALVRAPRVPTSRADDSYMRP